MAAVETAIAEALFAKVAAIVLSPVHPVAWPNVPFTPPTNKSYLRVNDVPVSSGPISVASDGSNEYLGLIQVDVMGPLGVGSKAQRDIAAAVAENLKRGTVLWGSGIRITIVSATVGPAIIDGEHRQIPVSINYRAFAQN